MMLTLLVTSKGVAGVPRASLVVLAGTLSSFGLPLEGVAVILGVDELMDMARTTVNVVGNCLAAAVVGRWEGELGPLGATPSASLAAVRRRRTRPANRHLTMTTDRVTLRGGPRRRLACFSPAAAAQRQRRPRAGPLGAGHQPALRAHLRLRDRGPAHGEGDR